MTAPDPLRDAVSHLDVDPLDAAETRVRQASEQRTTAPERRGIAATIARVIAWLAGLVR